MKKQVYILRIYGLTLDECPLRIRIEIDTPAKEVIAKAIRELGRQSETADDFVLVEEISPTAKASDSEPNLPSHQRLMRY